MKKILFVVVVTVVVASTACAGSGTSKPEVASATTGVSSTSEHVPVPEVTVISNDTPTPEVSNEVTWPYGHDIDISSESGGGYRAKTVEGSGNIRGRVNLIDPTATNSILVYKPAHLGTDPALPTQFEYWIEELNKLTRNPCDSTRVRADDASGWLIVNDGEDWVLEADSFPGGETSVSFGGDVCVVVPGYAVFKFENVYVPRGYDLILPTVNLPRHPTGTAGWAAYPPDRLNP